MNHQAKKAMATLALAFLCASSQAQTNMPDPLLREFQVPPAAAKPRVWWHWMNGNVTREGISKDLLWMHRSGIGGFQNFDAGLTTPQVVRERLTYMTPAWQEAFRFTTRLADSLGLEMAIAGSPGWSESGGPWVPAKDGMKKLVWTEVRVKGGKPLAGSLPQPPALTGPFQNLPVQDLVSGLSGALPAPPAFYEEVAVIAYKLPAADIALSDLQPGITASGGDFNLRQLTDGDLATTRLLPAAVKGEQAWIQFEFKKPQVIKAVTLVGGGDKGPFGLFGEKADTRSLEVSENGRDFRRVAFLPAGNLVQQTVAIPETRGRFFRVAFKNPPPAFSFAALTGSGGEPPKAPAGTDIAEIVLHPSSRIDRFEEKAAFAVAPDLAAHATAPTRDAIAEADIVDVSAKLRADGTLNWKVPPGNWKIIRFGYSLIGKQNHPASPEATGLEVDKLDAQAVRDYFENYLNQYQKASGGLMGSKGGLQFMVTDSWESGAQNWTKNMMAEFAKRRGYSLLPWMPVLTGQIVRSAQASEQFLWDFRQTIADLTAENHYDQLTAILQERGMKRYSESHENGRALVADGMDVKRTAAIPMSAMWTPGGIGGGPVMHQADIRESASVAHIYGQNLVAAESLTAFGPGGRAWAYSPEILKPTADLELASGLNRFVIHTSVHQPVDDKIPGLGLGPFGQWFNRHETWAGQAGAWTDYLARSCYLLQQGKMVADVLYYYGEDSNITALFGKKLPEVPQGYNYDFVNPHALLNLFSVQQGRLLTPSGMQYRLLVLDANSRLMSLKIARKIRDLVQAGAVVVGPKPEASPSLTDDQEAFAAVVNELWGAGQAMKSLGSGKVYPAQAMQQALADLEIAPDFEYTRPEQDSELLFVHRQLPDEDIYWVNNRKDAFQQVTASFRVAGKAVEIWHPETGKAEPVSYSVENGRTRLVLELSPHDAVFVVFRGSAASTSLTLPKPTTTKLATIGDNWKLSFQPDRGAPEQVTLEKLASWTAHADPGIKYFSGTGTYAQTIKAPRKWFASGAQLWLDLGEVKDLAEVVVNGESLGVVWKKPFRVDLSNALKPGKNLVEIKVTNLWVNRLIGDQQPGVTRKITYTTMPFYQADSPLLPSGLMGPVSILSVQVAKK